MSFGYLGQPRIEQGLSGTVAWRRPLIFRPDLLATGSPYSTSALTAATGLPLMKEGPLINFAMMRYQPNTNLSTDWLIARSSLRLINPGRYSSIFIREVVGDLRGARGGPGRYPAVGFIAETPGFLSESLTKQVLQISGKGRSKRGAARLYRSGVRVNSNSRYKI